MKIRFKCGKCEEVSSTMPKTSRMGDKLLCPNCLTWQTFNGSMEIMGGDINKIEVKE